MSWSSDIRCLYCDGRLPLYRKITSGQFCSTAHRKLYWQEQERLGVERLHQTHDSLRAFRPPEGAQAILGPLFEEMPPASASSEPAPTYQDTPAFVAADPFTYDADLPPQSPLWAPQIGEAEAPAPLAGHVPVYCVPQPKWPTDILDMGDPKPFSATGLVRIPLRPAASLLSDVQTAGIAKIPIAPRKHQGGRPVEPIQTVPQPLHDLPLSLSPLGYTPEAAEEDDVPFAGKLISLSAFAAQQNEAHKARRDPWPAAPFSMVQRAQLPLGTMQCGVTQAAAVPNRAGLRPLSIDLVPLVHGTWIDSLRAMGTEASAETPRYELSTPALRPRLRLAAGSRYPVATRDAATAVATIEPENLRPSTGIAIPERKTMAAAAGASSQGKPIEVPAPSAAGLLPLACAMANEPMAQLAHSSNLPPNLPQPMRTEPMRPASHLEPLDAKPVADLISGPPPVEKPSEKKDQAAAGLEALLPHDDRTGAATAWGHVSGFWNHAPRDLKLLVFGIPILLALPLHPALQKVPYTAPPQANGIQRGIEHNFQSKLKDQWLTVKQTMVDRAAIALDEDFRAGLDDWTSRGGTTDWAFDATGFVRPGPLALYRPSIDLTDYQMQFLGMIDKKALSWVVRAADFDDYYVVKLVVLKPGPVPTIGVTRYAVIHGVAQARADTTAFINAREDMLYRVRMDVHGDVFALTVQGQMVDSWSEPRLRKGGVGFFTARGEASRLRWVQVTHQYDMLGRLCAYLAPYNIPSTNGGWQP